MQTYCPPPLYGTLNFTGALAGFTLTQRLFEAKTDTNGFVGALPSAKTVFVVFRGSSDIRNWLSDFDFRLSGYGLCAGCQTHEGFAAAANDVYPAVRGEVTRLLGLLPDHRLVVTGDECPLIYWIGLS